MFASGYSCRCIGVGVAFSEMFYSGLISESPEVVDEVISDRNVKGIGTDFLLAKFCKC